MVTVKVEERRPTHMEDIEGALHKLAKELDKEHVLDEYKQKIFYLKPSARKHKQQRYNEHRKKHFASLAAKNRERNYNSFIYYGTDEFPSGNSSSGTDTGTSTGSNGSNFLGGDISS